VLTPAVAFVVDVRFIVADGVAFGVHAHAFARERVGGVGGDDAEVRLAKPGEHVGEDRADLGVGLGFEGLGAQLLAHGVPVHAVHLGVIVRVTDDAPRGIEGFGVDRVRFGEGGGGQRCQDRAGGREGESDRSLAHG
jgi:hypothetical protein